MGHTRTALEDGTTSDRGGGFRIGSGGAELHSVGGMGGDKGALRGSCCVPRRVVQHSTKERNFKSQN